MIIGPIYTLNKGSLPKKPEANIAKKKRVLDVIEYIFLERITVRRKNKLRNMIFLFVKNKIDLTPHLSLCNKLF